MFQRNEKWKVEEKFGVQSASMFYPNSCYDEPFHTEVQVHFN